MMHDPYVGKTYEEKVTGRKIKILNKAMSSPRLPERYICEIVAHKTQPSRVGKKQYTTVRNLENYYRKVSS